MKTIGLIGGMSWESSLEYYRIINETAKKRLGGLHSAKSVMVSVDFAEIELLQHQGQWAEAGQILAEAARSLEQAGADFVVLCTNTMHKVAGAIETAVSIPFLHIADPTAEQILAQGIQTVGLLGTRFTMEDDFYINRLVQKYGLQVMVPEAEARQLVHDIIYHELCLGDIRPSSKAHYITIMQQLVKAGAEGIILGCTEIGLLVGQADSPVPVFDTTRLHAETAVFYAIGE